MYRLLKKEFRISEATILVKVKSEKVWVRLKISNKLDQVPTTILPYFIKKCSKNPDKGLENLIEMLQSEYEEYSIELEEIETNASTSKIKHFPKPERHIYIVIKNKELEK